MRVIAGTARGRRLRTVAGTATRPTADKVKGAMFSILLSRVDLAGARILDLFSGSGALGIEALSRGAAQVTFVEQAAAAGRALEANLHACGFTAQARILRLPAHRALTRLARQGEQFAGALLDPPYGEGQVAATVRWLVENGLIRAGGWIMIEHGPGEMPEPPSGTQLTVHRRYGKTGLALLQVRDPMPQQQPGGTRAVYAGSFDPITNGHLDVIRRAVEVFPEVLVAVAGNTSDPKKSGALFTPQERVDLIGESLGINGSQATVTTFRGLLVDYCDTVGARVIIRGLRAVSDFEYEFQMAMMNRHLRPHIETVFLTASEANFYTSSRLVKEVVALGGDVRGLVPDPVYRLLVERLRPRS